MKKWFLLLVVLLSGCSEIQKPRNLISKDEMAQVFLENALYNNNAVGGRIVNPQNVSKYILTEHKITSQQFVDSYKYYLSKQDIPAIIDLAKAKIGKLDPDFKKYLKKQQAGNPELKANQSLKYGE